MYFTIGCLNARLYFLVEDYVQLESFYEKGSLWLETRQNNFNKRYFRNVQLMAVQHYANFLRANNQPEKAIQCLKYGLELCESMKLDLDVVYRVNFRLQLLVAQQELDRSRTNKHVNGKIKRALKFNLSPEQEKFQSEKLNRALQLTMASSKRQNPSTVVVVNSSGKKSTRKLKHPASNHSSSSSPETKSKIKAKLKFNICEDAIEIEDSDDNHHDELKDTKTKDKSELKSAKKIKSLKSSGEHYTPKISRKTSKISGKTIVEISPKLNDNHRYIDTVDLLDTPTPVSTNISASSSSSSSMENLKTKENHPPTDTDLVAKLESLELIDKPKKTKTTVRKRKSPVAKKMPVSAPIIILEDSPSIKTVENGVVSKSRSRPRNKNLTESKESEPTTRPPPTRRRRNMIKENNENDELNPHNLLSQTPSLSSTGSSGTSTTSTLLATSSTISTRRRQKI